MTIKLESPEQKLKTAAAILVNTFGLYLVFHVTFLICMVFNLPLWLAFSVNSTFAATSIFRVYQVIKTLSTNEQ